MPRSGGALAESQGESHGPPERPISAVLLLERPPGTDARSRGARERKAAKFWLQPVRLEYNHGFATTELNRVEALVRQHEAHLVRAWHDFFKPGD